MEVPVVSSTLTVIRTMTHWVRSMLSMMVAEGGWEDYVMIRHAGMDKRTISPDREKIVQSGGVSEDHDMAED